MENESINTTAEAEEQPKQSNKERIKEITDSIEKGIKELFESDKYKNYLATMSRFHSYSVNNTMLIYMQKPDATLVAGFNKWHDKFGRNVKKGEHGIKIIAPTPFKKKIEEQKLDPDTKMPLFDKDGKPITEEKTVQIPIFKPVTVFDVSQTEGKPLPELAATLNGNVENYDVMKEAICKVAPVPIKFEKLEPGLDGYFSHKNQSITIREGMSEIQTVCALIHETAHSVLHNTDDKEEEKPRKTEEIEAESIAYAVCKYFGIDTADNSFGYLASWSKDKEVKELKESLETINSTASSLISSIEKEYKAIIKEHEKEHKKEAETAKPEIDENAENLILLVDDKVYLEVHRIDDGVNVDYSFYDKDTFKLIDGGYSEFEPISEPASLIELAKQIAETFEYKAETLVPASADVAEKIEQANSETEREGDILDLQADGGVPYSRDDNTGFENVQKDEHLKTAELCIEDDADLLDGIINNGTKEEPDTVREEDAPKKESVIAKLNAYKQQISDNHSQSKDKVKNERGIET